jgi:hypothetical protein
VIFCISFFQRLREKEGSSEDPAPAVSSAAQRRQRNVRRRTHPGMKHLPELYALSERQPSRRRRAHERKRKPAG